MSNTPQYPWSEAQTAEHTRSAVRVYWHSRAGQSRKQKEAGSADAGRRGEVTGGQHLDGFLQILRTVILAAGFKESEIRVQRGVDVPGYYRPTKKWDIVVIREDRLCAAIEMKSQAGPSFGNNFNNRTEEALGSSADFWVAYREGVIGKQLPWLGYFMLVEAAPASTKVVRLARAVFEPMPVFKQTSYLDRYAILCERLVLERNYSATALLATPLGDSGEFTNPVASLSFYSLTRSLYGHLVGAG